MGKLLHISKIRKALKPLQFKKWFEGHWPDENWEKHYVKIGGKLPEKETEPAPTKPRTPKKKKKKS